MSDDDFLVEDEPLEAVEAALRAGRRVVTSPPHPAASKNRAAAGMFELYKEASGNFRFRLTAAGGEVILTSERYATKAAALKAIDSVMTTAAGAVLEDHTNLLRN